MTARQRIGILGGTFDPIHIGHLHIGQCALQELGLDQVVLMPAGFPPHKPNHPVTPAPVRLDMIDVAIEHVAGLRSSDLDLRTTRPSYTSELLASFRGANPDASVWFVIGSDSLNDFPGWHEPQTILRHARLAVAERPGWLVHDVLAQVDMPRLASSVDRFSSVPIDLSATEIRTRIHNGQPVDWLVPPAVLRFINDHKLYRATCHQ